MYTQRDEAVRDFSSATIYGRVMTARQKLDALIEETATRYFEGMTSLEREVTAIDTTLTGLRALAKAMDHLDRRFDELGDQFSTIDRRLITIDKRLAEIEASKNGEEVFDLLAGGLGLLRKRIKKIGKKRRK
jgi:hypothetical protein